MKKTLILLLTIVMILGTVGSVLAGDTSFYSLAFIKYDNHDYQNINSKDGHYFERGFKYILGINHNIDENFALTAENEFIRNFDFGPGSNPPPKIIDNVVKQLYLKGKIGPIDVTVGRFTHFDAILDDEVMGGKTTFGTFDDKLKISVIYGRLDEGLGKSPYDYSYGTYDPLFTDDVTPQYGALEMSYL